MDKAVKKLIHKYAIAGGAIAGALPIGPDAIALGAEEVAMVVHVGAHYGVSLTDSGANGIIAAQLGGLVGGTVFEVANIGYPFTTPIKISIAVTVIEGIGKAAAAYFERTYPDRPKGDIINV